MPTTVYLRSQAPDKIEPEFYRTFTESLDINGGNGMSFQVKNNIHWVGKIDWEIRKFHGDEYSTNHGSSYNSYLIKEDKIALIDTVWMPFAKEFVPIWPKRLISTKSITLSPIMLKAITAVHCRS